MERVLPAVLLSFLFAAPAFAQVTVADPWVRATVPHQKDTGAFMTITSKENARLVGARSPAAGTVEIHEMKMENNMMMMRAISGLDLPAGKSVELGPGGYHVMLLDIKHQLKEGDRVPLTLIVEGKDKKRRSVAVDAVVRPLKSEPGGMHGGAMR